MTEKQDTPREGQGNAGERAGTEATITVDSPNDGPLLLHGEQGLITARECFAALATQSLSGPVVDILDDLLQALQQADLERIAAASRGARARLGRHGASKKHTDLAKEFVEAVELALAGLDHDPGRLVDEKGAAPEYIAAMFHYLNSVGRKFDFVGPPQAGAMRAMHDETMRVAMRQANQRPHHFAVALLVGWGLPRGKASDLVKYACT